MSNENERLTIGSCFSGIGAMDLAAELHFGARTAWFCEREPYAQKVLARRWPGVPIHDDVQALAGNVGAAEPVDVLIGGPPCVDLSYAGRQAGLTAERSGLFFDFVRVAADMRPQPRWVVVENVPALLAQYRGVVESEFAAAGYGVTWAKAAAAHVKGCPHLRKRVFVLAELGKPHRGVCDAGKVPSVGTWPTPRATDPKGSVSKRGNRSPEAIAKAGASLSESVRPAMWPTPNAGNFNDGQTWEAPNRQRDKSRRAAEAAAAPSQRLSAMWVETLQGLPVGWTSLDSDTSNEELHRRALLLCAMPRWPAPMVKGMWGDSPQHPWEPPRTVQGKQPHRSQRLKALGNCLPPQQYLLALKLLAEGPRQAGIFDLLVGM